MNALAELIYRDVAVYFLGALAPTFSILASAHTILYKRDARSTLAWVGIIWFLPFLGALIYAVFGINRIQRRARSMRDSERWLHPKSHELSSIEPSDCAEPTELPRYLRPLATLVARTTNQSLLLGNQVELLEGGDVVFPVMLEAIASAKHSVSLQTYIFDNDRSGKQFAAALADATRRGVAVRVLIDDVGSRYSWPSAVRLLNKHGIRVARFLRTYRPWRMAYMNLRNHRKIMVIDGNVGFTGGMNIREGNVLGLDPKHPIQDLHARLEGPIVGHLQKTFVEDWKFTTGEVLDGDWWFPPLKRVGDIIARGLPDGPDELIDALPLTLMGALAVAQKRILIVTPYFIPDHGLLNAIGVAAMRGVEVDIVLPAKGNLALVQWASMATLGSVLERGCSVWLSPAPFDHTKLMVVDGQWTLLGSANWDARSLRLNFEFNVEGYDPDLGAQAEGLIRARIAASRPLTLRDYERRSLSVRLRDGSARLFSPYL